MEMAEKRVKIKGESKEMILLQTDGLRISGPFSLSPFLFPLQ